MHSGILKVSPFCAC